MTGILYILMKTVSLLLSAMQLLMMLRAVISWLPVDEDSNVVNFLYAMTEPVIMPVRMLLERFEALNELPIDISFIVAFMILSIVQMLLSGIV